MIIRCLRRRIDRARADERGAGYIAAFIVLFGVLTVAGVGILVDSARIVSADRQCAAIALEAARAGANEISVDAVRAGAVVLDPGASASAASAGAAAYTSAVGATLQSVSVDGTRVTVTISAAVDPWFPVMSGRMVSATASATATAGVTAGGQ